MQKNKNAVLKAALEYFRRGWCVIPVPVGSKKARIRWKQYQQQRPDQAKTCQWFASGKQNVALICGPVSGGLIVVDFDEADLYYAWAAQNPELAGALPTVKTARGYHVYCRANLTKTKPLEGIDIKASGYVLAPPSVHPSKAVYSWTVPLNGDLPFATLHDLGLKISNFTQEPQEDTEAHRIRKKHTDTQFSGRVRCEEAEVMDEAVRLTLPQKTWAEKQANIQTRCPPEREIRKL